MFFVERQDGEQKKGDLRIMYTLEDIQAVDMEVANAITDEFERQNSHIELIASENWVSPAVMSAMGSHGFVGVR